MRKGFLCVAKKVTAIACITTMTAASLIGCGSGDDGKKEESTTASEQADDGQTEEYILYKDASKSTEERVDDLMARMTLEQKVGQMIMAERNVDAGGADLASVTGYGLGAMLSGGGSAPSSGNTIADWKECINGYKTASVQSELGIPIYYGVDSIHGNNNVYGTTVFPHQIGLGATGDADLLREIGGITAMETRATGANYAFSPVLGLPYNELWGRTYECFGEREELVAELGAAYIEGYQGVLGTDEFLSEDKVIASAKHYIGEGQTDTGRNQGNVSMSNDEWEKILNEKLLVPYKAAVEAGVQTVMVSYNSINMVNCHENKYLVTDILKGELGFEGFVISDYDGVEHCSGVDYRAQLANCVNAGVDMLMEPMDWQNCYYTLIDLVKSGEVSEERIDDAVRRILTVKFNNGLFEEEIGSAHEDELAAQVGSEEHRAVARKAVSESITLLKNDTINGKTVMQMLPECKNIAVLGKAADDMGTQCGGWTISWTGMEGDITEGTTIIEGFKEVAPDKNFTHSRDTSAITEDTDAVIVVAGEMPYSESAGDTSANGLRLRPIASSLLEEAQEMVGDDVPVILVLLTGRPMTIAYDIENMDAFVCAWLPGTEGAGIADVLFGDKEFNGTTTITWPWYASDIDSKLENEDLVMFKFGSGLKKDGSSIKEEGTKELGVMPADE